VHIIGRPNLAGTVAENASQMYSQNIMNFILHFWDREKKEFIIDTNDEIMKNALVTHNGTLVSPVIRKDPV
jgi:NAD(P) transhydrogenase subunit alpha